MAVMEWLTLGAAWQYGIVLCREAGWGAAHCSHTVILH